MTGYQKTKGEDYSETKTRQAKAESVLMKLLSCPFCGSQNLYEEKHGMLRKYRYEISCNNCGASAPYCNPKTKNMLTTEIEVKKAWNTRSR